jgi:hypothetical protein
MSKDPRDAQRKFAADKFRWLYQVAVDANSLAPLAVAVCVLLCRYFNLDHDGRAWAYQDTLASALGVRRECINRVLRALVERGHLTSIRRGRDKSNHFYFVLKEEAASEADDVRKTGHHDNQDVRDQRFRCAQTRTKNPSTIPGAPNGAPGRERAPAVPAALGAAERREGKKQQQSCWSKEHTAALATLQEGWQRGWPKDNTPAQRAANRRAFEEARHHAPVEAILAGAKAWAAAFNGPAESTYSPYYLPSLSDWLANRSWEQVPPDKKKRRNGKANAAERVLEMALEERRREAAAGQWTARNQ